MKRYYPTMRGQTWIARLSRVPVGGGAVPGTVVLAGQAWGSADKPRRTRDFARRAGGRGAQHGMLVPG
jgi:hypothetical protein